MDNRPGIDQPIAVREAEMPDMAALTAYLQDKVPGFTDAPEIRQFPGGYSNLTFELRSGPRHYVLRMPPRGAAIRSAHDMGREYRVLQQLKPHFPLVPSVILYCEDVSVIGRPFYLMEKISGIILRNKVPEGLELSPNQMRSISTGAISLLADLHRVDIQSSGLAALGKPEGYVKRQVEGWIGRYEAARTDPLPDMETAADWMRAHMPPDNPACFIHNDFKYDNLVLDPGHPERIIGVLDWEMATIGDPLMDLGTTLAYWGEAGDGPVLKPFNLTWLPGNLGRQEVVDVYAKRRGIAQPDMLFYFVFGSYKVAVIVQQIYARYRKGLTSDPRFEHLHHVVQACARQAASAIQLGRIDQLNRH